MSRDEIIEKVVQKKEFSELPREDIEKALEKFEKQDYVDEEKVKLTRDFLRRVFSGFSGKKLFKWKDKSEEEILKKHLSTRERYDKYKEIYERVLKRLPRDISVIDLGNGVNGLSYGFFAETGKKVSYLGVEAIGQLSELNKIYFEKRGIKSAEQYHASLFNLEEIRRLVKKTKKPIVVFMFKVVDSLEKFERDYTKKFLSEIMSLVDRCVISFATESFVRRKKFYVRRKWLTEFIRENYEFIDDFEEKGERYLVFVNEL